MFARATRLEAVTPRRPPQSRPRYDFSAFDDRELEELALLAERGEAAGGSPDWTAEEAAVLARLEAKLATAKGTTP